MPIPRHSVLIGISLGGLVAASLQEESRDDLKVICISSPTWSGEVRLARQVPNRTSLYSSRDTVIAGRVEQWPQLARSFDLPWLSHDTDKHKLALSRLIVASLKGEDVRAVVEALPQSDEYRLKDIRPPGWMRGARRRVAAWMRRP